MSSYLITFKPSSENPKRGWPAEELKRLVNRRAAGERVVEKWRFRSIKAARRGERVFLLQQGKRGPAIIGYGSVAGAASKSSGQWRVPVVFEGLVDPDVGTLMSKEALRAIPGTARTWRTQSSGIRLPESVAEALERLIVAARGEVEADNEGDEAAERAIQQRTDIGPTRKATLINARRGQGIYRQNLEQIEKGCRVTGITDGRYLRASHIKPWCKSDDFEKLDGNNGLLLSPNVDHLFDGGHISFADNGELLVSKNLPESILVAMGLKQGMNVGAFKAEQCKYLEWHRKAYGFG